MTIPSSQIGILLSRATVWHLRNKFEKKIFCGGLNFPLNFGNNIQKVRKDRYQIFLILSSFTDFFSFYQILFCPELYTDVNQSFEEKFQDQSYIFMENQN